MTSPSGPITRDDRIEAHIFISFLAYMGHLKRRLRDLAPGLTAGAFENGGDANARCKATHHRRAHRGAHPLPSRCL